LHVAKFMLGQNAPSSNGPKNEKKTFLLWNFIYSKLREGWQGVLYSSTLQLASESRRAKCLALEWRVVKPCSMVYLASRQEEQYVSWASFILKGSGMSNSLWNGREQQAKFGSSWSGRKYQAYLGGLPSDGSKV
jgi:hypothetical protein